MLKPCKTQKRLDLGLSLSLQVMPVKDRLDHVEDPEHLVHWDHQAIQEHVENQETPDRQVLLVLEVLQVHQVQMEKTVTMEGMGNQE